MPAPSLRISPVSATTCDGGFIETEFQSLISFVLSETGHFPAIHLKSESSNHENSLQDRRDCRWIHHSAGLRSSGEAESGGTEVAKFTGRIDKLIQSVDSQSQARRSSGPVMAGRRIDGGRSGLCGWSAWSTAGVYCNSSLYASFQSIGLMPCAMRSSFILENGLLPKNPRRAESGDG